MSHRMTHVQHICQLPNFTWIQDQTVINIILLLLLHFWSVFKLMPLAYVNICTLFKYVWVTFKQRSRWTCRLRDMLLDDCRVCREPLDSVPSDTRVSFYTAAEREASSVKTQHRIVYMFTMYLTLLLLTQLQ